MNAISIDEAELRCISNAVHLCFLFIIPTENVECSHSLGQNYKHFYLTYGPSSILIYVLITELSLVNFGYLKLMSDIGDCNNFGTHE